MKPKVFITNISKDAIVISSNPEITAIGLHRLTCDRQVEGCKIEHNATSILHPEEYKSVLTYGYY
jgi:hypothetical protein